MTLPDENQVALKLPLCASGSAEGRLLEAKKQRATESTNVCLVR